MKNLVNEKKQNAWLSMCLLSAVINRSDKEIFEDNALMWYSATLKITNSVPSESLLDLCFHNLDKIISKAHLAEKISRELSSKGLESLLQLLTGMIQLMVGEDLSKMIIQLRCNLNLLNLF